MLGPVLGAACATTRAGRTAPARHPTCVRLGQQVKGASVYIVLAIALTVMVMVLAWRGIGQRPEDEDGDGPAADRQPPPFLRPHPRQTRFTAPDDDPEFLREIDRKLRGEDKSS